MIKGKEWLKEQTKRLGEVPASGNDYFQEGWFEAYESFNKLVEQLDEPELPVVPQMIGEYIEKERGKNTLGNIAEEIYNERSSKSWSQLSKEVRWLRLNFTLFAKAWVNDNYTTEQEKRYRVKVGEKLYFFGYNEMVAEFVINDAPGSLDGAMIFLGIEDANRCAKTLGGVVVEVTE